MPVARMVRRTLLLALVSTLDRMRRDDEWITRHALGARAESAGGR